MSFYSFELEQGRLAQRTLNELQGNKLIVDGVIGSLSQAGLRKYQADKGIEVTGLLDRSTWSLINDYAGKRFLTAAAIVAAAKTIGVAPSVVFAICEVEANAEGFLPDGRPLIQFERHKFHLYVTQRLGSRTALEWTQKFPNLCSPSWSQNAYKDNDGEWDRLDKARMLDATCALLSSSWGMFKIMGFNYALAGFSSVGDFVNAMAMSETAQLNALLCFIRNQPIFLQALHDRDFEKIAMLFNGRNYVAQGYHVLLEEAASFRTEFD